MTRRIIPTSPRQEGSLSAGFSVSQRVGVARIRLTLVTGRETRRYLQIRINIPGFVPWFCY